MPKYEDFDYWPHIEIFFNACFSLEMLMRVVCTTSIRKTVKDIYFVFDFLSVFPSWLEVIASQARLTAVLNKLVAPGAEGTGGTKSAPPPPSAH